MRIGHFTRLKGRTSYFRRKIPAPLRGRLASSEICVRLGVVHRDSAERLARRLAVAVDEFFAGAAVDPMLNDDDLRRVVASTMETWRTEHQRLDAEHVTNWGRPLCTPKEEAAHLGELAQGVLTAYGAGRNMYEPAYVQERFVAAGMPPPDEAMDLHLAGRKLSVALAAHYLHTAVEIADRHDLGGHKQLPVEAWRSHLERLLSAVLPDEGYPSATAPVLPPVPTPVAAAQAPKPSTVKLFSEIVPLSLDDRIATGLIDASARQESAASTRIWLEVRGNHPIDQYGRRDMAEFRSVLVRLPKSYWKSSAERDKPILKVIAEAKAKDPLYQKISNVTVNRHLSTIAPIFEWSRTSGHLPESVTPFWSGFHLPTGRRVTGLKANEERPAYSREQISQIFAHPVWTGRKSEYFYNERGTVIVRDSLYWCPLIAALHGMRREEFAQLRVRHVRQIDGIWVFDLHHIELKTKNEASPRHVPVHKDLIGLGFIAEVVEGRDGDERLFRELSPSPSHGKFGDALGKRFARIVDNLGIVVMRKNHTESDGAFHPFRHRLVTDLTAAGVLPGVIDGITGHQSDDRRSERARYTGEIYVAVLKEAVDKMTLPIDFEELNRRSRQFGTATTD